LQNSAAPKSSPLRLDLKPGTHGALAQILAQAFGLCPNPPRQTVSEWSDEHRILSPEDSAEPGKWRTARMEPMRGIMDTTTDPAVEEIVVQKGTQVGWTAVIGNIVGFFIDRDPCPILTLFPTKEIAEEWSKNRLTPMLRDTGKLRGKVKDPRSRDSGNTILSKTFPGGRLAIIGANAPANLASRPIRIVLCDETDRYPLSAGDEGDPMMLASKRQETFWNRKMLKGSSPTVKGQSVIERDYARSDKRKFYVPCPHCGVEQTLHWSQVRWDKDKAPDGTNVHKPETALYQCEDCGTLWSDAERWQAVSKGHWKATAPFNGIAGFHLSQLYSSWVKLSKVVTEFLAANGKLPGTYKDPEKIKVFVNTVLAETWDEEGETVDASAIDKRGEPYGPDEMPDGAVFATAGVDVQGDRLEVQIVAWGASEEAWAAHYLILRGDPAEMRVWDDLDQVLRAPLMKSNGGRVRILSACIDTGGHHTDEVHEFCTRPGMRHRNVYPIKGEDGPRPIWPVRHSLTKTKKMVWVIGSSTAKDAIYGRLKLRPRPAGEPNPGFIHFPLALEAARTEAFTPDYYAQLTVEKVVTKRNKKGRPERVFTLPSGKRNEALDTFAYALAARKALPFKVQGKPVVAAVPDAGDDAPPPAAAPVRAPVVAQALTLKRSQPPRRDPATIARMFR